MILNVSSKAPYDIIIEPNSLENIGSFFSKYSTSKKVAVISDDNVARLYADTVLSSFKRNNIDAFLFCIPSGENSKNINTVSSVLDFFSKIGIGKDDAVVALGGGIVCDVAGFSASVYMRGIQLFNIPTSLSAQIDSAIGDKNRVNLNNGKNLCGTSWQPTFVLVDSALLSTLPKKYLTDGLSTVVKYAIIADKDLFEMLENKKPIDNLDNIVYRCIKIKKGFVENEDYELSDSLAINFGYDFGNAIERYFNYELLNGQSLALGMLISCSFSKNKEVFIRLQNLLKKIGLPYTTDYSVKYLLDYMKNDKKKQDDYISLISIEKIGYYNIKKVRLSELIDCFESQNLQ